MSELPTASSIARFLQENPDFFAQHAELFAELTVPHPSQARAISLGERQIMVLRDRLKAMEMRTATLSHQANFNENIARKLNIWCARMLAEPDPRKLPEIITRELAHLFELSDIALRILDSKIQGVADAAPVSEEVRRYAENLSTPYCGPGTDCPVRDWLQQAPSSMAVIALRAEPDAPTLGLLVIGSDNKDRYSEDMATDFLQSIGMLAGSAISRLCKAPEPDEPDIA